MKKRTDYTIRPNRQSERLQPDLWDVVIARRELITTARSEAEAQEIADQLNRDPWFLSRGQTPSDRKRAQSTFKKKS